ATEQAPGEEEAAAFSFPYDPERPVMVLTFDDGPSPSLSPRLLDELNARGVKASFFVLGKNASYNREIIELEYASGHDVCSHGYDHQSKLTQLSDEELAYQLDETARVLRDITGQDPPFLRPPYGSINRETAAKIDIPMMLWTLDPRDWESRDAQQVRDKILEDAFDGAVVICHDLYESTLNGVLQAVDILLEQGWQFLSLTQYYQTIGLEPEPGKVYRGPNVLDL
ncbi:MAG: polysaccharide deacetylase family protein, partial [Bacillota bacterium]|nr:polysaccharide deacetylase family protein [Bacillota bacterium]